MTQPKPRKDIYQEVTDAIVAHLEAGTPPWERDWIGAEARLPYNLTTGKPLASPCRNRCSPASTRSPSEALGNLHFSPKGSVDPGAADALLAQRSHTGPI